MCVLEGKYLNFFERKFYILVCNLSTPSDETISSENAHSNLPIATTEPPQNATPSSTITTTVITTVITILPKKMKEVS